MKLPPRKTLLLLVGGVGMGAFILSLVLSSLWPWFNNPLESNLETALSRQFPHNYIFFQNRQGEQTQILSEVNGWLLLEAWLMKINGEAWSPELQKALEGWPSDQLSGWWPADVMEVGRRYLKGEDSFLLSPDIDDSIWRWMLANSQPSDEQMAVFLPNRREETEDNLKMIQLCQRHGCHQSETILRVWANPEWQDDWDMIAIANAVAYLQPQSTKMKSALQDSKKLINQLIRTKEYPHYFHYYEPKIAGTALLLLYHYYGHPYLDADNKAILLKEYQAQKRELTERPLISRWGGGVEGGDDEDWIGGYNLVTVNNNISRLLLKALESKITKKFP